MATRRPRDPAFSRRTLLAGGAAAGLGLALGACGSDDGSAPGTGAAVTPAPGTAFPVRVPHKFGTTTVRAAPKRVASVGGGDVDTLLALGIVPLVVPDIEPSWKADGGGVGPWSRPLLRGAEPTVVSSQEIGFEQIAAARPDLVSAVEFDLKRSDYDKLSDLAATIAPPKGFAAYTVPWDTMALQVGRSVGRLAAARKLVATARAQRTQAGRDNPAFARARTILVDPDDAGGVYVFAPGDVRSRFLEDIGLQPPAAVDSLFGEQFYAQISAERLDILDESDLIILVGSNTGPTKALLATRVWTQLKNVKSGRLVTITEPDLAIAMSYSSVLSTPYQLERLVPRVRRALAA
ncbi:Putative ABC transporter substrate-binding lipoprotein YhfQ [Paraconexibacter sp. AEG42_29]|uniref:ABC transporter substrate-binding lipoprotein YhfQ n=1 Tax=Paraconexibacter sp. AEG42_29 TaxID=2997339 RepID=A0AAU7AUV9_9ACTN